MGLLQRPDFHFVGKEGLKIFWSPSDKKKGHNKTHPTEMRYPVIGASGWSCLDLQLRLTVREVKRVIRGRLGASATSVNKTKDDD